LDTLRAKFDFPSFSRKKPLVIARRILPKRSARRQETASLKNARSDGFLEVFSKSAFLPNITLAAYPKLTVVAEKMLNAIRQLPVFSAAFGEETLLPKMNFAHF